MVIDHAHDAPDNLFLPDHPHWLYEVVVVVGAIGLGGQDERPPLPTDGVAGLSLTLSNKNTSHGVVDSNPVSLLDLLTTPAVIAEESAAPVRKPYDQRFTITQSPALNVGSNCEPGTV